MNENKIKEINQHRCMVALMNTHIAMKNHLNPQNTI